MPMPAPLCSARSTSSRLAASRIAEVANGISSATCCARAPSRAVRTAATNRAITSDSIVPSGPSASASRVGVLCRYTGSGGEPGYASTTRRFAELEPMSSTPSRMSLAVPGIGRRNPRPGTACLAVIHG